MSDTLSEIWRRSNYAFEEIQPGIRIPFTYRHQDLKLFAMNVVIMRLKMELVDLNLTVRKI